MENVIAGFIEDKNLPISELGQKHNLSFSNHSSFGNKTIAIDQAKRNLLLLESKNGSRDLSILDLNKIAVVTLKKIYGSINAGQLKHKQIDDFLKRVELQFQFLNQNDTRVFTFYDGNSGDRSSSPRKSGRNAQRWQKLLSGIIKSKKEKKLLIE